MNRIAVAAAVAALVLVPAARASAEESRVICFAPDAKTIAVAYSDKTVRIREVPGGKELVKIACPEIPCSLALSPDGKTLVVGQYGLLFIHEAATGKQLVKLEDPLGHVGCNSIAFAPDGKTFVAGGDGGEVRLFDTASGKELRPFKGMEMIVTAVAFLPDGKTIATSCVDKTVRLFEAETGKETKKIEGFEDWVTAMAVAPDGKTLATIDNDGALKVFEVPSGKELKKNKTDDTSWSAPLAFTPDGKQLACGARDGVHLLDAKAEKDSVFLEHKASLCWIAFSKDGKLAAIGDYEAVVTLVDVASKKATKLPFAK